MVPQSRTAPVSRQFWPIRLGIGLVAAASALTLTHLLWPAIRLTPFIFGFAGAVLSTWLCGRYAGFTTVLTCLAGYTFVLPPTGGGPSPQLLIGFVVIAGTGTWLMARRLEMEAALRVSESRLADAQNAAHIGSWEWRIRDNHIWCSDEVYRLVGLQRGEIEPSYDAFMAVIHPEDRARVEAANQRCFEHHEPFEVEHRIVRPDGDVRTLVSKGRVAVTSTGAVDRIVGIAQDITDRKAAEEVVAISERRLKTILDTQPACVKLVSADGLLLEMNPAGLRMLGVQNVLQVLHRPVVEVVHVEDRERFLTAHRRASSGEPAQAEFRVLAVDGRESWVDSHMVPFDTGADGGVERPVLSVTSDITDRKRLEDQLRQAQKMEAIGRLAGGIAHDFNNLLTVIAGFTSTAIRDLGDGAPVTSDLRQVAKATEAAAALTRQLLLFSRKQAVPTTAVNLNTVIAGVEPMLLRTVGEHIQIELRLGAELKAIRGNASQLEQVIMNLAVNARDAMPAGGILTLETANRRLDGRAAQRAGVAPGEYVELVVADTGQGMTPEVKARIFEPFFTTKDITRGTGLGLPTVYGILQSVGGATTVESDVDRGTTFRLYFPQSAPLVAGGDARGNGDAELPRGNETILLVEDDSMVRAFAARVLRMGGYDVLEAESPGQGLQLFAQHVERVDAIVTDVIMPGVNGRQFAKRARAIRPQTPVLYMSGYTDQVLRDQDLSLDGGTLLEKPFTPGQLLERIRQMLSASPRETAATPG